MRYPDTTFGEQHHIFPPKRFPAQHISEYLFTLIASINICMIKRIDTKLQAKVDDLFHRGLAGCAYIFPSPKSIDRGRNFRARVAEIDLCHDLRSMETQINFYCLFKSSFSIITSQ